MIADSSNSSDAVGYNGKEGLSGTANHGAVHLFKLAADDSWQLRHTLKTPEPTAQETPLAVQIAINATATRIAADARDPALSQTLPSHVYLF